MPEFCSCGAQLPDDARFCHKCGKPQRDEIVVEQPPPLRPAITVASPVGEWTGAPSFRHPVAVRVGFFVASIATFLCIALPLGFVVWLPAAGFLSVYLFSRRTGQPLSVRNGVRMGWISGILSFLIITVLLTFLVALFASRPEGFDPAIRESLRSKLSSQQIDEMLNILSNPGAHALDYLSSLLAWFALSSIFCTAGGAIGAKVLDKE
jgi:hypothetical protein